MNGNWFNSDHHIDDYNQLISIDHSINLHWDQIVMIKLILSQSLI